VYLTYDDNPFDLVNPTHNQTDMYLAFGGLTPEKMREEFSYIVNTTGYWIVWRQFDLTQHSQYWDESSQEAIGGPAWVYKDYIFKTRNVVLGRTSSKTEDLNKYGLLDKDSLLFYVSHKIDIKDEDQLLWIKGSENVTSPTPPETVQISRAYEIEMVTPKIDKMLIYYVVKAKVQVSKNDETLVGDLPVEYIPV